MIGGAIVGIVAWVVSILAGAFDPLAQGRPARTLPSSPLLTLLVPTLMGGQFAIGVLVATVVGHRRRPSPITPE